MTRYLVNRLIASLLMLLALSVMVFALVRLVPGDTVTAMLGANYNEQDAAALREVYALDQSLAVQYGVWLTNLMQGDLGQSTTRMPVAAMMAEALPVTLELAGLSFIFAVCLAIPLGVAASLREGGWLDRSASTLGLLGVSVPNFWLGTMLILLFALRLRWLPPGGFTPITVDPLANLKSMILPAVALGAAVAAVIMRMTRTAMIEVAHAMHVQAARARGLPLRHVLIRHTLRNAILPVLTVAGIQLGYLLGGSVVIEQVFSLPGIGRMALQALVRRDYPLLQGVVLLIGGGFIIINFLVDLMYGRLDPRITLESS